MRGQKLPVSTTILSEKVAKMTFLKVTYRWHPFFFGLSKKNIKVVVVRDLRRKRG